MLHPHLEQYATAIRLLRRINAILEARGITTVDCKAFHFRDYDPRNPNNNTDKTGYLHHAKVLPEMRLSWSLYYQSRDDEVESLTVGVDIIFTDNPKPEESWQICIDYIVGEDQWYLSYTDLVSAQKPVIVSQLGNELFEKLIFIKRKDTGDNTISADYAISAICKMAEFYAKRVATT